MGLFGKKEACPVCGGEVKGLFHKKIADKKTLCKDCSSQISMMKELQRSATPEYIREHLEYRRQNALKYNSLHWVAKYDARGTKLGVDPVSRSLYIVDADMDDFENPVVFSFDQITHYELYRLKKRMDYTENEEEMYLESTLSALGGFAKLVNSDNRSNDYFRLVLKTTEPYWPELDIQINFDSPDDIYGFGGFGSDLKKMCHVLKCASRGESVTL